MTRFPTKFEVVACIDAAFAVYKDYSSQQGIIVMLRESGSRKENIVHYSSTKSRRLYHSVLAAEVYAFVDRFDVAISI